MAHKSKGLMCAVGAMTNPFHRHLAKPEPGDLYFAVLMLLFVAAWGGYLGGGAYLLWAHGVGYEWVGLVSGLLFPVLFCAWLIGGWLRYDTS